MNKTLAIIGGGASATLLLAQLARRKATFNIDVYDRAGAFARGIAYSTPHSCHLVNVRASNMSALADVADDFMRWAAGYGYGGDDFVPRTLYGDYLHEHLERARKTVSVHLIRENADSTRTGEGYLVNGKAYDLVVQATGNCVPLRPQDAENVAGYHDGPWTPDYAALSSCTNIALIGSGLSAVDAIVALDAHGYSGSIRLVSRTARLPGVHVKAPVHPAFMHAIPATARAALRHIRNEINTADAPWQAVIDSLRPCTNAIWQAWPERERQRFMRHLFTWWNVHRHRMAGQIGDKITALEQSGRLIRHRARVHSILPGPALVTSQGTIRADAIINCLGYRYDERALAASHAIGPARFGSLFETTAIPEIRVQAAQLADAISQTG